MAKNIQITGMKQVLANLLKASKGIKLNIRRGLRKGGEYLQGKSMDIVPVQLGNLKSNAFTRDVTVIEPDIIVGYASVDYAVYVHEDMEKVHGSKFNVKYADEIARTGTWSSDLETQRTTFKKGRGKGKSPYFPRGENQQAKFLEKPARDERGAIFAIIHRESKF